MKRLILAALLIAGCTGSNTQHAELDTLKFDVPSDWQHTEAVSQGAATAVWSPASSDNARKESVTITRTAPLPAVTAAGQPVLDRLLLEAQAGLHGRAGKLVSITTQHGLVGARIDVEFVPPGLNETYHRVHAVFSDGPVLVHVLYTAKVPDAKLEAFNLVLATIQQGEG